MRAIEIAIVLKRVKTKTQTILANKCPTLHCALHSFDKLRCRLHRNSRIITVLIPIYPTNDDRSHGHVPVKESSNRFAVKNKRNKKIPDALRGSGLPRRDEAKGGKKEGRVKEKREGVTAACWQFFKESVHRLTGMNATLFSPQS